MKKDDETALLQKGISFLLERETPLKDKCMRIGMGGKYVHLMNWQLRQSPSSSTQVLWIQTQMCGLSCGPQSTVSWESGEGIQRRSILV